MKTFITRVATWEQDAKAIMHIRNTVFVQEQKVPVSIESDEYDAISWYAISELPDGTPVACARLQPNGKVTRIAVIKQWRRQGAARELLKLVLDIAEQQNLPSLYLHAQLSASKLYEEFGFIETGQQFEEAGIMHIKMIRAQARNT